MSANGAWSIDDVPGFKSTSSPSPSILTASRFDPYWSSTYQRSRSSIFSAPSSSSSSGSSLRSSQETEHPMNSSGMASQDSQYDDAHASSTSSSATATTKDLDEKFVTPPSVPTSMPPAVSSLLHHAPSLRYYRQRSETPSPIQLRSMAREATDFDMLQDNHEDELLGDEQTFDRQPQEEEEIDELEDDVVYPTPSSSLARSPVTRKEAAELIPLDRLIRAGTIRLSGYRVADRSDDVVEPTLETDGWLKWERGHLSYFGQETIDAGDESLSRPGKHETTLTKDKPGWKGKGKAMKPTKASTSFLDDLASLTSAFILRATYRLCSSHAEEEPTIILRIYLVPDDAEERFEAKYLKVKKARPSDTVIINMLKRIRVCDREWNGEERLAAGAKMLLDEEDHRSILELYRDVEAPADDLDDIDDLQGIDDRTKWRLVDALRDGPEIGMLTEMFPYQKASLAKMLARELAPQHSLDPRYASYHSALNDGLFYISHDGRISIAAPRILEPKSGILAEDMGAGKTCICLSLILATKGELAVLDEDVGTWLDGSSDSPGAVILTKLSKRVPFKKEMDEIGRLRLRVPEPLLPLAEMNAADIVEYERAISEQARLDEAEAVPALPSLRTLMIDYLSTTPSAIRYPSTDDKRFESLDFRREIAEAYPFYYLHPSPDQLSSRRGRQRNQVPIGSAADMAPREIVVSRATLVVVPSILVKQWENEISKHVVPDYLTVKTIKHLKDKMATASEVVNYDIVLMSIRAFSDEADLQDSLLKRIHWKRLIIDEGHALASPNRMREMAEELRCESRWAMSGTISRNLRAEADVAEIELLDLENEAGGSSFAALGSTSGGNDVDFKKLGQLFSRFLRHPTFTRVEDWRKCITVPIWEQRRGSSRLARVFNQAIVRNPLDRVRQVVQLPPLTKRIVEIEMGDLERKTYNALLAFFSNNSILSQRTDEDYLFHPKQSKALKDLVLNLSASSFFFSSTNLIEQIRTTIQFAREEGFTTEKAKKFSDADKVALLRSIEVMEEAVHDPAWRHATGSLSVAVRVDGMHDDVAKIFNGHRFRDDRGHLFSLGSLVTLRGDLREVLMPDVGQWKDDDELVEEVITYETNRLRESAAISGDYVDVKAKEARKRLNKSRKLANPPIVPKHLPSDSVFTRLTMGVTTSAKLNYVVSECREHSSDKFIVFSCTLPDLVFATLSEAFDLMGIRHMLFAGHANGKDRGQMAARFNESSVDECQVILVDARLGGRGLNLTAASRVIMLEPLWQPDLEVQAIKRAHRLGQRKPVDLSILVVKGSYEDALLQRRSQLSSSELGATKLPQKDEKLRDVLQAAQYLDKIVNVKAEDSQTAEKFTPWLPLGENGETEVDDPIAVPSAPVVDTRLEKAAAASSGAVLGTRKKRTLMPDPTFVPTSSSARPKKRVVFAVDG